MATAQRGAKRRQPEERKKFSLTDDEVLRLARWASIIEDYYSKLAGHPQPMDIEWAKDGITNELFIVQARPRNCAFGKAANGGGRYFQTKRKCSANHSLWDRQSVRRLGAVSVRVVQKAA